MISVFYDRKNKQEVRSDQLMRVDYCRSYAGVSDEGMEAGTPVKKLTDKYGEDCLFIANEKITAIGYKSDKCPAHMNWDMVLNESDLIFLRLE